MKKFFVLMAAVFFAANTFATSYGILVNGKMYYAATYQGPDPYGEGFEQYLAHVPVKSGDYCQMYDADYAAAWAKPLNSASAAGFTYDEANGRYNVTVTGCYDFYIKLKWEADELYIGSGSNCGEGVDITKVDPVDPTYSSSAPAKCPDVMLQAFYWNSTDGSTGVGGGNGYGRTKWIDLLNGNNGSSAEEIGQWFDLIWIPSVSKGSGLGYHPSDYSSLDSDRGTKQKLEQLIETIHKNGGRVVADIVINHGDAKSGWCGYASGYNFGTYGKFVPDGSYICSTDEINYSSEAPAECKGFATGNDDDGYGDEANYAASRDWDHKNTNVQNMFKAYLKWLRNVIKIDGFRYDYCKGYHNSHINDYNKAAEAYFSVMEYWDGDAGVLQSRLSDAGWNTATFDFATKYTAFNQGIASGNYSKLQGCGLLGAGKSRYAVTFIDSHDSFQRDNNNEFCGNGNSMGICADKLLQANAFMLSMPGVPCVFWPHWVTYKEQIKKMINARYKTGVHSESSVSDESTGNGFYKATITGTNGQIRLLVGPNSGYDSTPNGFTLAVKGNGYGVYYKMNSNRGDKNTERIDRTVTPEGIEDIKANIEGAKGEKFIENGNLYIRCGEQVFDAFGRRVR
ncbi:MAG: hypothetical protein II928_00060 [Paludibacteraceae bacterium]|nr:hypothetical protein [Paludibacteraceae bacterium]